MLKIKSFKKKILSFTLIGVLLVSGVFSPKVNAVSSIEIPNQLLEIIENNDNISIVDIGDMPEDSIVIDSIEEYKELIKEIENLEFKAVEIDEVDKNETSLFKNTMTREKVSSLKGSWAGLYINTLANFEHYSSGSFRSCDKFNFGSIYLSGNVFGKTLTEGRVSGYISRGHLQVTGRGIVNFNIVFEGIGTIYRVPIRTEFTVTPELRVTNERLIEE